MEYISNLSSTELVSCHTPVIRGLHPQHVQIVTNQH